MVIREGHFEEAETVGDGVGGAAAEDPDAEEQQRVNESARTEQEVVDDEHCGHGEQHDPGVVCR